MSLSVELRLDGRRCVVAGGGRIGTRRAMLLIDAGAVVTVVAPEASEELRDLAAGGRLSLLARRFRPGDADGAVVVVAATDSAEVNEMVQHAAESAGALVHRADDAGSGDLLMPAVIRAGALRITVSSDGRAPAVTRWAAERLRGGIDGLLDLDSEQLAMLVDIVAEVRAELAGSGRVLDWRSALDRTMLEEIRRGHRAVAKERLKACLSSS
ncbi:MAG: bifunctional precorrin-2 dehydrogenase/sirohydrochlorin ferrochelatase [Acidimicrobiales bacterium]